MGYKLPKDCQLLNVSPAVVLVKQSLNIILYCMDVTGIFSKKKCF